mgnify:CR=1 FL=1
MCSLPYTQQPIEVREYERRHGRMSLVVEAGKLQGPDGKWVTQPLPHGTRARLLLLHLCSEAIRQKSPTIQIEDSLTAFIEAIGFPVTGGPRGSLTAFKQQINALAACHMRIGVWNGTRASTINTQPFSRLDVWLPDNPDQRSLWPSTLTFSRDFFDTLTEHALPVNIHAVKAFANSPRKLDLMFWLSYRLKNLGKPQKISWTAAYDQFGQGYGRLRAFRTDLSAEIREMKEVFPKLGIADRIQVKMTPRGTGATEMVAKGEADLAVMPVSEIVHAAGVELAGVIHESIQLHQVFAAAVVAGSAQSEAGRRLIEFLASPRAGEPIRTGGMAPLGAKRAN